MSPVKLCIFCAYDDIAKKHLSFKQKTLTNWIIVIPVIAIASEGLGEICICFCLTAHRPTTDEWYSSPINKKNKWISAKMNEGTFFYLSKSEHTHNQTNNAHLRAIWLHGSRLLDALIAHRIFKMKFTIYTFNVQRSQVSMKKKKIIFHSKVSLLQTHSTFTNHNFYFKKRGEGGVNLELGIPVNPM